MNVRAIRLAERRPPARRLRDSRTSEKSASATSSPGSAPTTRHRCATSEPAWETTARSAQNRAHAEVVARRRRRGDQHVVARFPARRRGTISARPRAEQVVREQAERRVRRAAARCRRPAPLMGASASSVCDRAGSHEGDRSAPGRSDEAEDRCLPLEPLAGEAEARPAHRPCGRSSRPPRGRAAARRRHAREPDGSPWPIDEVWAFPFDDPGFRRVGPASGRARRARSFLRRRRDLVEDASA